MKKKTAIMYKVTTVAMGIALATLLQSGISFAGDSGQEVTSGSIRIEQEESEYPALAQISMEQAKDIALANVQGKVLKMELENENGFLVYDVEVVTPEKIVTHIAIDAGNGEILSVEKDVSDNSRDWNDHDDDYDRDREDDDHGEQDRS